MSFHVLMYHELRERGTISEDAPSIVKVATNCDVALPKVLFAYVDDFEKQMDMLQNSEWNVISMQEVRDFYEKGQTLPENAVLITFDDAFQSVLQYAYPILKKRQLPATLFVVRDWLSESAEPFDPAKSVVMSVSEVNQMRDVFTFANHTSDLHNQDATGEKSTFQTATTAELLADLKKCAEFVDMPDIFAYPFGAYTKRDLERLEQAEIKFSFTTKPGRNKRETSPLELHRQVVALGMDADSLKQILLKDGKNT
ncbi:putative exported polysaccharide deacetylase [Listeria fleischmannii 1991]|uniref:Poly-beta-1,6-N-acetyl-D-glucosamine N-deacetylase n=2 Tax=Listeria fleischmannii TaxID=1069827 RepID=A0A2X3HHD3_9LIST|nr:polysaccharide deacetylase family protein [Listeria fleischmannii]EMG27534.1 putative exported polysaccharide deacetylase [Listeria fleischmannii subsp. fleischmannii LU2006-1]KMT59198.1 putative exported polysaccharide deacetylase [Listeria fleischmannii 1991]SQC70574.1 Poly-beta-1,6-N-acetyl-D-glucosamine N-deacetylase precursor [Listeria fleischmannii subsp. fleischmannii]